MCGDGEEVAERRREQRRELLFGQEFEERGFEVVDAILEGRQELHDGERIHGGRDESVGVGVGVATAVKGRGWMSRGMGTVGCTCPSVASHVTRSPSRPALRAQSCYTRLYASMTASIWHADHARCRELASPDMFNLVISV